MGRKNRGSGPRRPSHRTRPRRRLRRHQRRERPQCLSFIIQGGPGHSCPTLWYEPNHDASFAPTRQEPHLTGSVATNNIALSPRVRMRTPAATSIAGDGEPIGSRGVVGEKVSPAQTSHSLPAESGSGLWERSSTARRHVAGGLCGSSCDFATVRPWLHKGGGSP